MDFFKNIDAMQVTGEWVICIKQTQPERMTVSVQFKNEACGDEARKIIPPLAFTDKTATELDIHLFEDLQTAVPETAKLFGSMEHYLKQREEAKKQSQIEKDKADKEKKAKDGKFRDAYGKLPNPFDFPEQAAEIEQPSIADSSSISKILAVDRCGLDNKLNRGLSLSACPCGRKNRRRGSGQRMAYAIHCGFSAAKSIAENSVH